MANKLKDKVVDAGHTVADAAKGVGHKIAAGTGKAIDFVKEKTGLGGSGTCDTSKMANAAKTADIREHMEVFASCGTKVGVVDCVEGEAIKLTRNDSRDGLHHFIPLGWVDHVDSHVHLKKNSVETEQGWKSEAASCCS